MTRRTTRRWVARAALCVALGLVTTVAVAWALAAWLPHTGLWSADRFTHVENNDKIRSILTWECGRAGMLRRAWRAEVWGAHYIPLGATTAHRAPRGYVPRSGPRWAAPLSPDPWADRARVHGYEDARGWPWLALWCEYGEVLVNGSWQWQVPSGMLLTDPLRSGPLTVRVLPLRPLWPGLLGNTGVYALAWAALLLVPTRVRRAVRHAKGRCTGCGYDRAGLAEGAACPECGKEPPL